MSNYSFSIRHGSLLVFFFILYVSMESCYYTGCCNSKSTYWQYNYLCYSGVDTVRFNETGVDSADMFSIMDSLDKYKSIGYSIDTIYAFHSYRPAFRVIGRCVKKWENDGYDCGLDDHYCYSSTPSSCP